MAKHVAILYGGWSAEREVSLASGRACCKALEGQGYKVTPIDVQPDIATVLQAVSPDVVFNALHGRVGEDGTIQGLLEVLRIPYTHSGVLASALAMQKDKAKIVMAAAGVPVPRGMVVNRSEAAKSHVLPAPYVIKPVNEGSSVGVIIVREDRSHPPQELTPGGLGLRRASPCGIICCGPRADLRGHGRQGARGHRHPARHRGLLRLRRKVCEGGLHSRPPGRN